VSLRNVLPRRREPWAPACAGAPSRAKNARDGGFTLVELMVTITVVALMSAAVVWAVPDTGAKVRDDALRFAARVRAARDQAIVSAQPVSVWVTAGGYGFDQRASGRWVPMSEKPLRVERWAEGARAALDAPDGRARVTYDPTGLPDRGADIRLAMDGRAMLIRLGADGSIRADAQ
jgi:general secretion pathway protein H